MNHWFHELNWCKKTTVFHVRNRTGGRTVLSPNHIVPYVRDASFPVRTAWYTAPRRLLDYLLMYVQEGKMVACVEERHYQFRAGDFCLIQPGELHTLEGPAHTITPYVHLDFFY